MRRRGPRRGCRRGQWLAGPCTRSGLTCGGTLTGGRLLDRHRGDGASAGLTVGGSAAQTLTVFPIGGPAITGYAGLPEAGWWYEPGADNGVGYFFAADAQSQADGSAAQLGYLAMLAYDGSGRRAWQAAQATLRADLSFSGTLTHYADGAPVRRHGAGGGALGQRRGSGAAGLRRHRARPHHPAR